MTGQAFPAVDDMISQLRAFRAGLAEWTDGLHRSAHGQSPDGSVRATCAGSGEVTGLEIDPRCLREDPPARVEKAILTALRRAQRTAARQLAEQQNSMEFLGFPIGEVLSGQREFTELYHALPRLFGTGVEEQEDHRERL